MADATGIQELQQLFIQAEENESWPTLELNQRVGFLAEKLAEGIGTNFEQAERTFRIIIKAFKATERYEQGYALMFLPAYVERYGLGHVPTALSVIEELTQLVSCEFVIRPLIIAQPEQVMAQMQAWAYHEHASVRRLASEGCRPRLPWGMALKIFIQDPRPIWPILTALRADEALYVRKSVANNLNDISRDHPAQVLSWAAEHVHEHEHTRWIINHGLRTLLKAGNANALALLGWQEPKALKASIEAPARVHLGQTLHLNLMLETETTLEQARIELAIGFFRPNKTTPSRKVFMVSKTALAAGRHLFTFKYKLVDYTTLKHYAGMHSLNLLVNGVEVAATSLQVI